MLICLEASLITEKWPKNQLKLVLCLSIHLQRPPLNQIVRTVRQLDGFLHRPWDDLVMQRDVGNEFVVGQQGFFYQGVAGG